MPVQFADNAPEVGLVGVTGMDPTVDVKLSGQFQSKTDRLGTTRMGPAAKIPRSTKRRQLFLGSRSLGDIGIEVDHGFDRKTHGFDRPTHGVGLLLGRKATTTAGSVSSLGPSIKSMQ